MARIKTREGYYELKLEEQEVSILMNRAEGGIRIQSTDPRMNRKLDKLCDECPEVYQRVTDRNGIIDDHREFYITDETRMTFRKPTTEAQRKAGEEKARRMHSILRNNVQQQETDT